MSKPLFPFKHGDVQNGNWSWAVGAEPAIPELQHPWCIATTNFHGANAAGYDCEKLAALFAEAPVMLDALGNALEIWDNYYKDSCYENSEDDQNEIAVFEEVRAILRKLRP